RRARRGRRRSGGATSGRGTGAGIAGGGAPARRKPGGGRLLPHAAGRRPWPRARHAPSGRRPCSARAPRAARLRGPRPATPVQWGHPVVAAMKHPDLYTPTGNSLTMQTRRLGRSGIEIAPLVFGGNVFGWTADRETSFRMLDRFVERGFNAIDTADVYSAWAPGLA